MREANPLWGAPRIHGELHKLGIDVSQATVAKYLGRRCGPPSQSWRTFLTNHVSQLTSIDFFTVPTATSTRGSLLNTSPHSVSANSTCFESL
jgi:putative transposase